MGTITKKKIIDKISKKVGMHPAEVRMVIQSFLEEMAYHLSNGDRLEFRDFGVFEVVMRMQKIGRNPKDPKKNVVIPAKRAVKFISSKKLKMLIETFE